jgi:nitrate reductase gamma subunit
MAGPILLALSYGLLAIFAVALVVKSVSIARLPVHLRWELAPVPKERTRGRYGGSYLEEFEWWKKPREESLTAELVYILKEVLLLKALWEPNRRLWWFSFPFHWGLYLLVVAGGLMLLAGAAAAAGVAGPGWGIAGGWLPVLAGLGYAVGGLGALGLLISRLVDPKLQMVTTPVALFNLVLLLALFVTGGLSVLTVPGAAHAMVDYARALFTAHAPAPMPGVLTAHVWLALVFLAYLPFSQMLHFVAKYFTYHEVRWDDRPLERGSRMEREVESLMKQPVTWAAPHVAGEGRKNWVDIATEGVRK